MTSLAWLIPTEVIQTWAVQRVNPTDAYAQFEALGIAEAVQWAARWLGLGLAAVFMVFWRLRTSAAPWIEGAIRGFWRVTAPMPQVQSGEQATLRFSLAVSIVKRVALLSVFLLSLTHWGAAIRQRFRDWPYYRFNGGDQILPNMSESNREVIRYLRTATPDHSRILVVSDQKLFFLSYHLRPRQLFHRMHPEAEHLIPRANQARQLAAFRLEDLPPDVWECHPEYVLEYFEGSEYLDPSRTTEDRAWLECFRERSGDPVAVPGYVVSLRRWPLTGGQP